MSKSVLKKYSAHKNYPIEQMMRHFLHPH